MLIAIHKDEETFAEPGMRGSCPECGDRVIAKCGEIVIWHWAHVPGERTCALAAETEWHLGWKKWALGQGCQVEKVIVPGFRADIVTPANRIIELQNQGLPLEDVRARELAYHGRLTWIVHCTYDQQDRVHYGKQLSDGTTGLWYERGPKWLAHCRAPVYLDFDGELCRIRVGLKPKYNEQWGTTSMRMLGRIWPAADASAVFDIPTVVIHKFCKRHRTHFCPCVKPGMYDDAERVMAAWDA